MDTLQAHPEGISIQEVAEMMGIHRNTAAKYLEVLQSQGEVDVRKVGVSKLFIPGRKAPYSCVRRLFETPVIGVDRDLGIVDLNDRAISLLGKSEKELIGSPVWREVSALGTDLTPHIRETINGRWHSWESGQGPSSRLIRGIPVKYSDGRTGAAIVLIDQNQVEGLTAERDRMRELFTLITAHQTEYVIRLNSELNYVWVNPAYAALFDLTPTSMEATRFSLRIPEEERESLRKAIYLSTPEGTPVDYRVLLPSGDIRYHHGIFRPITSELQGYDGYLGVCQDITEIRLKEEQFQRFFSGTEALLAERTQELRDLNRQMYREIAEREQVETTLRSIEFAVQHVTDMILWFDPCGIITYMNHSAREILFSGSSAENTSIERVIQNPPLKDWDSFWKVISDKKTLFHELSLTLADNRTIPAEIIFNHMHYGNQEYCCCVGRDIHERKLAMAELIESENRFRQLAGIIPEIFYLYDLKASTLLYINPAYEQIFGVSIKRIYLDPSSWRLQLHEEDRERVLEILSDFERSPREIEGRIIRPDGEVRWIEARIFTIPDENDEPYREVGVISDITMRKKTEEELRLANDRFTTTMQAAPVSIYNQDTDLRYTWIGQFSPGFTSADLLGKTDHDIFPPDVAKSLSSVKQKAIQSGRGVHADLDLKSGDQDRSVRIFIEPFRDLQNVVVGITGAEIDLTDLFRVREALRMSEEKFRRFFDETEDICLVFRIITDEQGTPVDYAFDDLNRQALTLMGKTKKELIGEMLSRYRNYIDPRWFSSLYEVSSTGDYQCFEEYSSVLCRHFSVHLYPVGDGRIGVISRDISALIRSYEQVQHQRDLALSLSSTTDIHDALHLILRAGTHVPGIDSGGIYFVDDDMVLHLEAHLGISPEYVDKVSCVRVARAVEEIFCAGSPFYYTEGLTSPTQLSEEALKEEGLTTYVSLPILNNDKLFAILNFASHTLKEIPFIERPYLEALPAHLGETLARVRHEPDLISSPFMVGSEPVIQIIDSDYQILEGPDLFENGGTIPPIVQELISGGKEMLLTGQEICGEISLPQGSGKTCHIRVRFIPWGREVAYLLIWRCSP